VGKRIKIKNLDNYLTAKDNHDTYEDNLVYFAKDLVDYAGDIDPDLELDRHDVADFLSDFYNEDVLEDLIAKMQTREGHERVMQKMYGALIRQFRKGNDEVTVTKGDVTKTMASHIANKMSNSNNPVERKFYALGKDKGLSSNECLRAFTEYSEVTNRFDQETALEFITKYT